MANTRNVEAQQKSINLLNSTINIYRVEKAEDEKNDKYALGLDGKIYVLTKDAIDNLVAGSKHVIFSIQTIHMMMTQLNVNKKGLINEELEKQILNEAKKNTSDLIAIQFASMVYLFDEKMMSELPMLLFSIYQDSDLNKDKKIEKLQRTLSINSLYQPVAKTVEECQQNSNSIAAKEKNSPQAVNLTLKGMMFFSLPKEDKQAEIAEIKFMSFGR